MNKQIGITAGTGLCGMFAGVLLVSGGIRLQTVSLAGLLAAPIAAAGLILADSKAQNKINAAQDIVSQAQRHLDAQRSRACAGEEKEAKLRLELAEVQQGFARAKDLLKACEQERCQSAASITQLNGMVTQLQTSLETGRERVDELEAEVEEWEREFIGRVNTEAEKLFQTAKQSEIKRIESENDEITREALEISKAYREWAVEVDERLLDRGEFIKSVTHQYNGHLDGLKGSVSTQIEEYIKQIEILNCKVAMLQQKLEGDLVAPEYGQFGYAVEGKIANDIARKAWEDLQIPLAVKGYQVKSDGSTDIGYGYSHSVPVEAIVNDLQRQGESLAKWLGIHKITSVCKQEISDLIVLTFRREAALKESAVKLLAGTPEEFLKYVINHPIRYRLIADPGEGKTPTTAVMLSAILREGCRRGNTARGKKVPHTLVLVSYPGAQSSLKDSDYPLERFLKYGTTTAAIKSFDEAVKDWEYRQQNVKFAEEFFQIRVWDELDNTINSADDPTKCSEALKKILKQGGHSNIGWIVSGQSVMTSQIKGFKDDDRSLFTEIIIGIPKIRMYVKKYARGKNSDANLAKLERNLDDLEAYIESANDRVTDDARLLRIALVIDEKSPKLYFLPNLDNVNFDEVSINESEKKAVNILSGKRGGSVAAESGTKAATPVIASDVMNLPILPRPTMQGSATCPHCGSSELSFHKGERYYCKGCKSRFVASKVVFK